MYRFHLTSSMVRFSQLSHSVGKSWYHNDGVIMHIFFLLNGLAFRTENNVLKGMDYQKENIPAEFEDLIE